MIATISKQGQLSQRYTNHCIRLTAITILDEARSEDQSRGISESLTHAASSGVASPTI